MEALAATATVIQISIYASNIASALHELRSKIQHGSIKLQERSKRLEVLELVVKEIEQDPRLHRPEVAEYLTTIRDNILRLHAVILYSLQSPRDTPLHRLRAGLALFRASKQIEDAFASLGQDCQVLTLYLRNHTPGTTMPQEQQRGAPQFDQQGELPADPREMVSSHVSESRCHANKPSHQWKVIPYVPTTQANTSGSSPGPGGGQSERTADEAHSDSTAAGNFEFSFTNISSRGESKDGKSSSNEIGNIKAAKVKNRQVKEVAMNVRAESGGTNKLGCIT
jgi:hypothetical protein